LVPNQSLTPFSIADGNFHLYRFEIVNGSASFSIDGTLVGTGFQPFLAAGSNIAFGALADASRSDTDLAYLCFSTTPN
jgi:hypothetical protein